MSKPHSSALLQRITVQTGPRRRSQAEGVTRTDGPDRSREPKAAITPEADSTWAALRAPAPAIVRLFL